MPKEKFILVSLQEEESKKLAQIISNDTSRKILDFLADKEATESELATALNIPISTVHYNLQALAKGKLVEADEFHYSEKGKEVLHYKLANKYIIISPKPTFGIRQKLKSILPVALVGIIGSGIILLWNKMSFGFQKAGAIADTMAIRSAAPMMESVRQKSADATAGILASSADIANNVTDNAAGAVYSSGPAFWQTFVQNPALWFLFGCVFTLILIVIVEFIIYKRNK